MDSITVGGLTLAWNGNGLTVTYPGGMKELTPDESYSLLCWLYDDQRRNIYQADHPGRESEQ